MSFTKGQTGDFSELRDMAYEWGGMASRRAFGEDGPGLDLDFDSIESLAVDMGRSIIQGLVEDALQGQLRRLGDRQPCPGCERACPVVKAPRTIQVRHGTVRYDEPVCHCSACRRDFFPSSPEFAARFARLLAGDAW